jgi:hypothetical protein
MLTSDRMRKYYWNMDKSTALKLAGAAALAGSSQAYGQIVPLTPLPSALNTTPGGSSTEYYTLGGSTSTSPGGDLQIDLYEDNSGNLSVDVLPVQSTDAVAGFSFPSSGVQYAFPAPLTFGAKIGTGSANTPTFFTGDPAYPFFAIPFAQLPNSPQYIGFQFGPAGNIHDGYLELDSLSPGDLTFLSGAYNSVAEDGLGGGDIFAVPEPSTLSALVLGAVALGGLGLARRRRSALAVAQD